MTTAAMVLIVTKRFTFEAAHQLPYHTGKCHRVHGHSYVLDVSVRGPIQPDEGHPASGMVVDFEDVRHAMQPVINSFLEHHSLNDMHDNPTAENILAWIVAGLRRDDHMYAPAELVTVRLFETATGWVEWRKEDQQ